ncbi:hypothetical protein [Myxococcus qinghaiensis]|uniref:hypothetical protein n=1 Tax=Myxococcus qinghaiensis TaxID=2906758 RepID=UPI0020A7F64A|nr:hypothetical protein [Myxococcus qinghaiensis]MCP3169132.1 hypothetical protein [Myxococcus qinghaiensis]
MDMQRSDLDNHRRILGIGFIAINALTVLAGIVLAIFFAFGGLMMVSEEAQARDRVAYFLIGGGLSACVLAFGLPGVIAGIGLLKRRRWSRVLALVLGIIGLFNFPLGTCLGIYAIWFYAQEGSDRVLAS